MVFDKKFRILTIDGGGLKGIFTLYAIKQLSEEYGIDIYEEFDMFVGTSTGALLTALILARCDIDEAFEMYKEKPNIIFKDKFPLLTQLRKVFFAQFKNDVLLGIIDNYVGDRTFDEFEQMVKKPFIFTATNITEAKPVIYGSSHFRFINQRYKNEKVKDALYSSSAAPFYFEPLTEKITNNIIVDGGLWANNPIMVALTYAIGDLGAKFKDITVLSFGQTSTGNLDLNIRKGFDIIRELASNELSMLVTSSLVARHNFDNLASMIFLKDKLYRYEPEKDFKNNKLSNITDEFVNYTYLYWEQNKEKLVKFIKEGRKSNLNYFSGKEKLYN